MTAVETYQHIQLDIGADAVAVLTLNRPEKLNALSWPLMEECWAALDRCREDDGVRVIIVRGAGRSFSAGYDLSGGASDGNEERSQRIHLRTRRWMETIWENPKAIIAQVHGYALAGGGDLAALCDITVAADTAVFGRPIARLNPHPAESIWPWLIGLKKTKELELTGDFLSAQDAWRLGLVNHLVTPDELEPFTRRLAVKIAKTSTRRWRKGAVNAIAERFMGIGPSLKYLADLWAIPAEDAVYDEWNRLIREQGLKAAMNWRDQRFAE